MRRTAGELLERVELMDFALTDGGWAWVKSGEMWAGVALTGKSTVFSKLGIGARSAEVTIRRAPLTLHQALRWRGLHLFLSALTETERGWLDVQSAVVELTQCRVAEEGAVPFPAVLTAKYLAHAQETPMAVGTGDYVLVVPKAIRLRRGMTLEVGYTPPDGEGRFMLIRTENAVDPYKNEYELREEGDL